MNTINLSKMYVQHANVGDLFRIEIEFKGGNFLLFNNHELLRKEKNVYYFVDELVLMITDIGTKIKSIKKKHIPNNCLIKRINVSNLTISLNKNCPGSILKVNYERWNQLLIEKILQVRIEKYCKTYIIINVCNKINHYLETTSILTLYNVENNHVIEAINLPLETIDDVCYYPLIIDKHIEYKKRWVENFIDTKLVLMHDFYMRNPYIITPSLRILGCSK